MEKKKKNIVIGVTSLLLATLILLGLTYAYYKTKIVGNSNEKSVSVVSKNLQLTYEDGTSSMVLGGTVEPGSSFTKEFTVKGTGNTSESQNYYVVLENIESTFLRMEDWHYKLEWIDNGNAIDQYTQTGTLTTGGEQVIESSMIIGQDSSKQYRLTITYENSDEDQSIDMGSSLSFKVNISSEHLIGENTWENPNEGTLLYSLKNNSGSSLLSAEDDYGTSYYFEGNGDTVNRNFVNYSGMCWRVVRVQGNGTIKLVLQDENNECNSSSFDINSDTSMFASNATKMAYTTDTSIDAYLFKNTKIPSFLETWSNRSGKELDRSKMVRDAWCNDGAYKKMWQNNLTYDVTECTSSMDNLNYSYQYHFASFTRLSNNNPSLKCNSIGEDGSKSTRYYNEIGLLTGDEVFNSNTTKSLYAGSSSTTYLIGDGSTNTDGLTMTPMYNYGTGFNIINYALVAISPANNVERHIRPAIVLKNDVLATTSSDTTTYGNAGTYTNPYVIS